MVDQSTCEMESCENQARLCLALVMNKRCERFVELCSEHVSVMFDWWTSQNRPHDRLHHSPGDTCFEIELVIHDRAESKAWIGLCEVDGPRRIHITTGDREGWYLICELRELPTEGYPFTHRALASLILTLGARLQSVVVHDVVPPEDGGGYYARLCIEHQGRTDTVDILMAEALILAVVFNVPIFVSDLVVAQLSCSYS
jgi:bifunctional DNase/RNase